MVFILHSVHVPAEFLFHFLVFENSRDDFLQPDECCFTFYNIIKGFVVHASPEVTLEEDLARRDLTINAMAFSDLFWAAPKIRRLASGSSVLAKNGNCKRILRICSAKSVGAVGGGPDETGAFLVHGFLFFRATILNLSETLVKSTMLTI